MSKWVLHGNNKIQCNSFLFNMASVDAEVDERMGGGEGGGRTAKIIQRKTTLIYAVFIRTR